MHQSLTVGRSAAAELVGAATCQESVGVGTLGLDGAARL